MASATPQQSQQPAALAPPSQPGTPGPTTPSIDESGKKSFWKWSSTVVPGSIRALTARSPGPLSLKKKKSSGGSTADDADWDESEDEVIAAFATSGTPQAGPGGVTSPPPKTPTEGAMDLSDLATAASALASSSTEDARLQHSGEGVQHHSSLGAASASPMLRPQSAALYMSEEIHLSSAPVSRTVSTMEKPSMVRSASQSAATTMLSPEALISSPEDIPDANKLTLMSPAKVVPSIASLDGKRMKFRALINSPVIDLDELRKLCWNGIPDEFRPLTWKLLMGYLPLNKERRQTTLERKRMEYVESVAQNFGDDVIANLDQKIFHQIHIDVPRTNPDVKLFQHDIVQRCLERILYVWAIRHPASGYVQGINDLVTPFFLVFLSSHIADESDPELVDPSQFTEDILTTVEADSYWCLSKLLDGIQDNYTQSQPGIQRRVFMLKELVQRIDAPLHNHLQQTGIEFLQFSFRWMNCLLMREMSLKSTVRMWDTYMAEGVDGFANFHLYVCAAFLISWSKNLLKMEAPEEMLMFLQDLPSQKWSNKEVEILLSEAYMWKSLYQNAQSHLNLNH